jgi:hypothetical protein
MNVGLLGFGWAISGRLTWHDNDMMIGTISYVELVPTICFQRHSMNTYLVDTHIRIHSQQSLSRIALSSYTVVLPIEQY